MGLRTSDLYFMHIMYGQVIKAHIRFPTSEGKFSNPEVKGLNVAIIRDNLKLKYCLKRQNVVLHFKRFCTITSTYA